MAKITSFRTYRTIIAAEQKPKKTSPETKVIVFAWENDINLVKIHTRKVTMNVSPTAVTTERLNEWLE